MNNVTLFFKFGLLVIWKDILLSIKKHWNVFHAVDDNPNVIRLWEEHGIPTTKIGTWDGDKS